MQNNIVPFFICFLVLSLLSCKETELPPIPESKGNIKGRVLNEFGQPIDKAKVTVELDKGQFSELTKENGLFEMSGIVVGSRVISIEKEGFVSYSGKIQIEKDLTTEMNFELKSGITFISVNDSLFIAKFFGEEFKIGVTSNASWLLDNKNDWINTSIEQGNGNAEINLSVASNPGIEARQGIITFKSGEVQRSIKIEQSSATKITSVNSIYGFSSVYRSDSVRLDFNNPVKIISISPSLDYCYPNFPFVFKYSEDKKSVTFEYECGDLGWSYNFGIAFEDNQGNKFNENFEVDFFEKKFVLEGFVQQKSVDQKDNSIWILTSTKNLLYKISMEDLSVINQFEIPFEPRGFAINDVKKEIYVYSWEKPYFEVFDQYTFKYLRRVNIIKDDFDHPDFPVVYPNDLQFTNSGKGIFSLEARGNSALKWKMIDSNLNDQISLHDQFGHDWELTGNYLHFDKIYQNHDKSKLLMVCATCFNGIAVFDQSTNNLSHAMPNTITRSDFLVPNRNNDMVFKLQLYNQSLFNPISRFETESSFFSTIGQGVSADFGYNPENEFEVYFYKDNNLTKIDYSNLKYESLRTYAGLSDIVVSSEGRSVFLFRKIGNHFPGTSHYYTTIYMISTEKIPKIN